MFLKTSQKIMSIYLKFPENVFKINFTFLRIIFKSAECYGGNFSFSKETSTFKASVTESALRSRCRGQNLAEVLVVGGKDGHI